MIRLQISAQERKESTLSNGQYDFKEPYKYTLHIKGEGNFTGDGEVEYTIGKTIPLSKVSVSYKKSLAWGLDPEDQDEGLKVVLKYKGNVLEEY